MSLRISVLSVVMFLFFIGTFLIAFTAAPAHADHPNRGTGTTTRPVKIDMMKERIGSSTMRERKHGSTTKERKVDLSCMQSAIDTREASIISAITTFHGDFEEALNDRKTDLNAAWGMTSASERGAALKAAWASWRDAQKAAVDTMKKARKSAWDTFKNTAKKSCKETLPKEEALSTDGEGTLAI